MLYLYCTHSIAYLPAWQVMLIRVSTGDVISDTLTYTSDTDVYFPEFHSESCGLIVEDKKNLEKPLGKQFLAVY